MKLNTILEGIGGTPHLRLAKMFPDHEVWAKLERSNPGGSIKDRIALAMVEDAEAKGLLKPESTIVEPTSGNTGIGLAMVAAVKGYRLVLTMPESMSVERRRIMAAYGAELVLTPKEGGMKASIARAQEIAAETPDSWIPMQFDNPANVDVHVRTTAQEILDDFPEGLDCLVTGVGTGGHITGVGRVLKQHFAGLRVYAVEPAKSPVLSGGEHTPHKIQGIGAGFIPSIMDTSVLDGTVLVEEDDAFEFARRAAREEGLFIGASSGASLAAVAQRVQHEQPGTRVLTFTYDTGERYLSIEGLFG